jgi:hypothetical protein
MSWVRLNKALYKVFNAIALTFFRPTIDIAKFPNDFVMVQATFKNLPETLGQYECFYNGNSSINQVEVYSASDMTREWSEWTPWSKW